MVESPSPFPFRGSSLVAVEIESRTCREIGTALGAVVATAAGVSVDDAIGVIDEKGGEDSIPEGIKAFAVAGISLI